MLDETFSHIAACDKWADVRERCKLSHSPSGEETTHPSDVTCDPGYYCLIIGKYSHITTGENLKNHRSCGSSETPLTRAASDGQRIDGGGVSDAPQCVSPFYCLKAFGQPTSSSTNLPWRVDLLRFVNLSLSIALGRSHAPEHSDQLLD